MPECLLTTLALKPLYCITVDNQNPQVEIYHFLILTSSQHSHPRPHHGWSWGEQFATFCCLDAEKSTLKHKFPGHFTLHFQLEMNNWGIILALECKVWNSKTFVINPWLVCPWFVLNYYFQSRFCRILWDLYDKHYSFD